jgi:hypothetical protein
VQRSDACSARQASAWGRASPTPRLNALRGCSAVPAEVADTAVLLLANADPATGTPGIRDPVGLLATVGPAVRPVTSTALAGHDWRPPWNPQDNDWRGRFRDAPWGNDLPPWGWGAPPPPIWDGPLPPAWGLPPPPINYFGYNEQPVWDPGYNQWGFYFFGIWIPLPF